jgi:hypothetical protein
MASLYWKHSPNFDVEVWWHFHIANIHQTPEYGGFLSWNYSPNFVTKI